MSYEGFAERLKLAMGQDKVAALCRKCGFTDGAVKGWLAGSMPGIDKVQRIAEAYGVRYAWLAVGEGPMRPGDEALESVDVELLADVLSLIEETLDKEQWVLVPEKKAQLVALVYREAVRQHIRQQQEGGQEQEADRRAILRLIKLVAA